MVANFYLFLDHFGLKTGKSLLPQQIISNSVTILNANELNNFITNESNILYIIMLKYIKFKILDIATWKETL